MNPETVDPDRWMDELPLEWCGQVVTPVRFTRHEDRWAHAVKLVGLDADGLVCWQEHLHTQIDECFDIDECPVLVPRGRERRVAWRLTDGSWLLQIDRVDRLDSCRPRLQRDPLRQVRHDQLGF